MPRVPKSDAPTMGQFFALLASVGATVLLVAIGLHGLAELLGVLQ